MVAQDGLAAKPRFVNATLCTDELSGLSNHGNLWAGERSKNLVSPTLSYPFGYQDSNRVVPDYHRPDKMRTNRVFKWKLPTRTALTRDLEEVPSAKPYWEDDVVNQPVTASKYATSRPGVTCSSTNYFICHKKTVLYPSLLRTNSQDGLLSVFDLIDTPLKALAVSIQQSHKCLN